jgi:hypothetical protein
MSRGEEVVDVSGRGASFGVRASQPRAKFVTYELLPVVEDEHHKNVYIDTIFA